MIAFLLANLPRFARLEPPPGGHPAMTDEPCIMQCVIDAAADATLELRFDGEQRAEPNQIACPLRPRVVRRQRTRRLVIPAAAERDGDGRAQRVCVTIRCDGHHGVVREPYAHPLALHADIIDTRTSF